MKKTYACQYRIIITDDCQETNKVRLVELKNPQKISLPMHIDQIKKDSDLIAKLHPCDVNTINDLYYAQNLPKYKIIHDNKYELDVIDLKSGKAYNLSPNDLFFSGEYKEYSNDDQSRIAYTCGMIIAEKVLKHQENKHEDSVV